MHVMITGGAGMIGRKLVARLVSDKHLNGKPLDHLTLIDIVASEKPFGFSEKTDVVVTDLSREGEAEKIVAKDPDVIFHLAAIVSGEAESDFEKGYRVNLDGTRQLLEAVRKRGEGYKPKVIFTSSIAVFGVPFPDSISDDFHLTPLTSYGTQKAICELLLADYTRKGVLEGIGIRLPTIVVRPGKPNKAASGFFFRYHSRAACWSGSRASGFGRYKALVCFAPNRHWISNPRRVADARTGWLARQSVHARSQLHSGRTDCGPAACRRRQGGGAHPQRTG